MTRTSTVFTVAGVTLISGLLVYAVYFDYRRRNDASFRKQLRKEKKKIDKHVSQTKADASVSIDPDELRAALEKVRSEDMPASSAEREQFFMSQVGMGEQLCTQGPVFHLPAALCFYRALRVYPSPVELIVIYQKTVPEPVFKIVMDLMNMDVSEPSSSSGSANQAGNSEEEEEPSPVSPVRSSPPSETSSHEWDRVTDPGSQTTELHSGRCVGYYNTFPPKSMNVKVDQAEAADGKKKILVAAKDIKAGDVIYKEQPIVTVLDLDLEGTGRYCTQCFRQIEEDTAVFAEDDRLSAVYCSKDCQARSKSQSENILFGIEPLLPPEIAPDLTNLDERKAAQQAFVDYLKRRGKAVPLLVSRFLARQVASETMKMVPGVAGSTPVSSNSIEDGEYSLMDHIERLRYLVTNVPEEEVTLVSGVLKTALPGIEAFVSQDRQTVLSGKMAYNAIGVCFGNGRNDKPDTGERPEDRERTRTPFGTSKQIGSGFYAVSAYINHSCDPSARPSFSDGTAELSLIANRDIKEGEEITMAYVDVSQHPDESPVDARRRRRIELARGWRFACTCTKCLAEGAQGGAADTDVPDQKDESKVEEVVQRVEGR
ncbi:MAS20-domain-containing protein [Heliocybe sulcata]|uniref:MAS20-domain-containing protein n=1 Tax=Heliocybe sulcata TaxID=5364 RepID=A0A5C3NCA3_9AGAM|nr:MAS20-domain-containing protein [Heliocybe sulcata]